MLLAESYSYKSVQIIPLPGSNLSCFPHFELDIHSMYSLHLEKEMEPHSSTLAWKIPWMEEPVGYSPWGHTKSDTAEQLRFHFSLSCIREGNGNPLHCSCMENPRDGGAWWAAIYGVAQSPTRLSDLAAAA